MIDAVGLIDMLDNRIVAAVRYPQDGLVGVKEDGGSRRGE